MAKKAKVEKELRLEDILFNCRDQLRGKASMADKRDLLLTLVFLRFIGEKFTNQKEIIYNEQIAKGRDPKKDAEFIASKLEYKPAYAKAGVFYLPEECRWETIAAANADATLPMTLDNIINQLELDNAQLKGALPQKIFTSAGIAPKDLKAVIDEVSKISQKRFPERDLIGRVYEYFLQAFAFQVKDSKEEGEFYTPHSIVNLIASIIEPIDGTIYDPCCGSGGMFVQSMKVIEAHGGNTKAVSVYGQEIQPETYRLAKMNLAVRGISHDLGNEPASTFLNEMHKDKKMDYVITNPPFNLKKWRAEDELTNDPRWAGYDIPPVSNANYAWILHILNKLNVDTGIAGFLLANGALDDSDTVNIRKKLIENDKVESIIMLPRNMFYTTDISVTLWILNQNKKGGLWHDRQLRNREGEVLFIDLRTWTDNVFEKKYVEFTNEQIARVCDIYHTWQTSAPSGGSYHDKSGWKSYYSEPEFYYAASQEEILAKGCNLVPNRYISFIDRDLYVSKSSPLEYLRGDMDEVQKMQDTIEQIINSIKSLEECCKNLETCELSEIGPHIESCDERNKSDKYGVEVLRGVTSEGVFDKSKAKTDGLSFTNYKIVHKADFAYNPSRINLGSIALCEDEVCIISPMYQVFRIKEESSEVLDSNYLNMWFKRKEFQRSTLFYASGSVRDTFSFEEMKNIRIPIPNIDVQRKIGILYNLSNYNQLLADSIKDFSEEISHSIMKATLDK